MKEDSAYKKDECAVVVAMETMLIFSILSIFMVGVYLAINNINIDITEYVLREELTAIGYAVGGEITNMNAEIDSSFSLSHQLSYQKTLRIPRTVADTPYSITINSSSVVLETASSPYVRVVVPMRDNLPVYETTIYSTAGYPVLAFHNQSGMLYFANSGVTPPIDDAAPTVNITAPPNLSTVSNTTTITTSATDNVAVIRVEYYVDGIYNATKITDYTWNWDTTTLTNGNHTVTARAYDRVFHYSEDTRVYYVSNNDTGSPVIYDLTPADGSTVYRYVNSTQSVTVQASYTDDSGINTSRTVIKFNETYVTNDSTITSSYVKYEASPTALTNNTEYPVKVTACDYSSLCTTQNWSFTFITLEDTTAPLINITSPLANSSHNHGEAITVTFDVWDNESGLDYVMVNVTNSSGARIMASEERIEFNGETTSQSGQIWTSTYTYDSSQAPYNITLRAYNMNANYTTVYVNNLLVSSEIIVLVSSGVAGGHHEKVKFKVKNNGTSLITIDKMNITWTNTDARIKEIKAKSPDVRVWKWDGSEGVSPHGTGTSTVTSGTIIDIDDITLSDGEMREFEAKFEKYSGGSVDMRSDTITVTFILTDASEHTVSFNT
jgi:hypothetical protein